MQQSTHHLQIPTRGKGLYEITGQIAAWLRESAVRTGLLTVFVQHTSASLTIQENADPDVIADLNDFFGRIATAYSELARAEPARIRTIDASRSPAEVLSAALGALEDLLPRA